MIEVTQLRELDTQPHDVAVPQREVVATAWATDVLPLQVLVQPPGQEIELPNLARVLTQSDDRVVCDVGAWMLFAKSHVLDPQIERSPLSGHRLDIEVDHRQRRDAGALGGVGSCEIQLLFESCR